MRGKDQIPQRQARALEEYSQAVNQRERVKIIIDESGT